MFLRPFALKAFSSGVHFGSPFALCQVKNVPLPFHLVTLKSPFSFFTSLTESSHFYSAIGEKTPLYPLNFFKGAYQVSSPPRRRYATPSPAWLIRAIPQQGRFPD